MAAGRSSWKVCVALLLCALIAAPSVDAKKNPKAGHHPPGHGHHHKHPPVPGTPPNNGYCDIQGIIRQSLIASFNRDKNVCAGLLRIFFHESMVNGFDGSLLLTGAGTEQTAPVNGALHGFDAIDAAKAALLKACPTTGVSCADIEVFATRDCLTFLGAPFIKVTGGRLDGRVSLASSIGTQIPGPQLTVDGLTAAFAAKGLSQSDLVVLSGAHTIGKARCITFQNRLFTFSSTTPTDPALNPDLAAQLKQLCPSGQNQQNRIDMDSFTPNKVDNGYYVGLTQRRGFFTSDDSLFIDSRTTAQVKFYATNYGGQVWLNKDFPASFIRMSEIGVKTGSDGEIRTVCSKVN